MFIKNIFSSSNKQFFFCYALIKKETSEDIYLQDDVKDSRATSFTMETMGNLTNDIRGAKDYILLEHFRNWFSTKNISIVIVYVVG